MKNETIKMKKYYLVFDAGTQSVKVAVFDDEMHCAASASMPTSLSYPKAGWVEMDADEYLTCTVSGMKACAAQLQRQGIDPAAVMSVMGDGIICGIVGINAAGRAITPYINYLDSRTKNDAEQLKELGLSVWREETGNAEPLCMFPAMHARWLLKHHSGFQKKGEKFVHNAPYILMRLADLRAEEAFIDWGTLSGWGLGYDVMKKVWSKKQLTVLDIAPRYLPRIVKPWDIIGRLSEEMAEETGFSAGIPICAGAGDTMQSMLGCGIFEAGHAVDVAGTCAMFCVSTKGIIPALSQAGSGLIFNSGTLEDTYFYWGFVRTGGLALRWFKDNICGQEGNESYYRELSNRAAEVPPGCNGVLFLPYLTGGYADSDVRGCFINMTMDSDQSVLWRSVLEAIAYDYREVVETYRQAGIPINRIHATEGGSRDALWNQIKADVLGSRVVTYENAGGAVLMNAIIGSYAVGSIHDLKETLQKQLCFGGDFVPHAELASVYGHQATMQKKILHRLDGSML
jgi:xylulokinase